MSLMPATRPKREPPCASASAASRRARSWSMYAQAWTVGSEAVITASALSTASVASLSVARTAAYHIPADGQGADKRYFGRPSLGIREELEPVHLRPEALRLQRRHHLVSMTWVTCLERQDHLDFS